MTRFYFLTETNGRHLTLVVKSLYVLLQVLMDVDGALGSYVSYQLSKDKRSTGFECKVCTFGMMFVSIVSMYITYSRYVLPSDCQGWISSVPDAPKVSCFLSFNEFKTKVSM